MRWRGRGAAVAATVLVGLMAAGCTGDATPTGPTGTHSPSASADAPSATPTVSPTPDMSVAPARPDAMATPSADGAAAAASYFLSLHSYMYATGDTAEWRSLSAATCEFCSESATDAETRRAEGVTGGGAAISIQSATGMELRAGEWYRAQLRVAQAATSSVDAEGEATTGSAGVYDFDFAMSWSDGWVVDSVGITPVPG